VGVGDEDAVGSHFMDTAAPIQSAIDHDPLAVILDQQGGMPPMTPVLGLDVASGAEKSKFHDPNPNQKIFAETVETPTFS
jgi:hypothetical protein